MKTVYMRILLGLAAATVSQAGIVGTPVMGNLSFLGDSTNYFDASNGFVPNGCLNAGGVTVIVDEAQPSYCFADTDSTITIQIGADSLRIDEDFASLSGAAEWTITLAFAPGVVSDIVSTSDTFDAGGLASNFSNDIVTLNWTGSFQQTGSFSADFGLTPMPEPKTGLLLLGATLALRAVKRWQFPDDIHKHRRAHPV